MKRGALLAWAGAVAAVVYFVTRRNAATLVDATPLPRPFDLGLEALADAHRSAYLRAQDAWKLAISRGLPGDAERATMLAERAAWLAAVDASMKARGIKT